MSVPEKYGPFHKGILSSRASKYYRTGAHCMKSLKSYSIMKTLINKKLIKILQVGYFTLQELCENSHQWQTRRPFKIPIFFWNCSENSCFYGTISMIRQHIFGLFLTHPSTLRQKKYDGFRLFLKKGIVIQKYFCPWNTNSLCHWSKI